MSKRKRYFIEVVEMGTKCTYTFFDFLEACKKEKEVKQVTEKYNFYWGYSSI